MSLKEMLLKKADEMAPLHPEWPDRREYTEDVSQHAISGEWLERGTSYIWKVGVLAQWDSNKCDHARLFIGQERMPGRVSFVGMLYWEDGENDDIGNCLRRAVDIAAWLHPVFDAN